MTQSKPTTQTSTGAGGDSGASEVQAKFDEANEKGYFGDVPDDTPNENYTLQGVGAGKPTPETERGAEAAKAKADQDKSKQHGKGGVMANPATIADIEDRWRPLTPQESTNAEAYLSDAWWLLLGKLPLLETYVADGLVSEGNVTRVVTAMVLRILRNPDGKLEESIDDYRYRRDSLVSAGELLVTAEELASLTPTGQRHHSVRLVAYGEY